ncbi:MAG: exodeoxyribonuclease VII large subunit [Methylococcaceae bacterium]|nr:exodeoxyribonuclease VII large subunit [Methylococcaceae bacterium]
MAFNKTPISETKIYSVSELNKETKNLLSSYFSYIQVKGEISNLSTPSSGHIYFTLKDQKAQIRCAMFKSQQRRLNFKPENGKQVIISAQVSLYEARGDYQLIADKMQEAGKGDLQLAFDQLKTKLLNEGLFDQALKQAIPDIPKQIGIITSATGAAIHDILTVLNRRFPAIPVLIYPTAVQGDNSKFEISKAIERANLQKQVDVIILTRGGGSLEDLWAFNEECVARAIVNSKIPIISAIGHEVDFTIADFVADLRSPTPSAAAENVVPDQQTWYAKFQAIEHQLQQIIQRQLAQHHQSLSWLAKRLQQLHPGQQLQRHAQALDSLEIRLVRTIQSKIKHSSNQISQQNNLLQRHNPVDRIIRYKEQQQYLSNRLNMAMQHRLKSLHRKQLSLIQTLNAVSPLATLERGYAIVSESNTSKIIRSSQQLSINDKINIRLAHGEVISQIKEINNE